MANRKKTNVSEILKKVMIVKNEETTPSLYIKEIRRVFTRHYSFHLYNGILALKRFLFAYFLHFHKKAKC